MTARKAVKKATPKAEVVAPAPMEVKQEEANVKVVAGQRAAIEERMRQQQAKLGALCIELEQIRLRKVDIRKSATLVSAQLDEAKAGLDHLTHLEQQAAKP